MKVSEIDLRRMLNFDQASGRIFLGKERMLLFRQDSFAVLRRLLVDQVGHSLARAILSQFGFRCGAGDYASLNNGEFSWDSELDEFSVGPILHTQEGIVHVTPTFLEMDRSVPKFHMRGEWRHSYEAEIHLSQFGVASEPECYSLTGYASGWCSAFVGAPTVAIETQCLAKGDKFCAFEIRLTDNWGPEAEPWKKAMGDTNLSLSRELEDKIATIEQQAAAIQKMSTPVMEIWDEVLALPVVGVVDARRGLDIMTGLLSAIVAKRAKCAIIDITGMEVVDTHAADCLVKVVRAAGLLGTRCVLTGLSPAAAQTLVEVGADLGEVPTRRNLKAGLHDCIQYLQSNRL